MRLPSRVFCCVKASPDFANCVMALIKSSHSAMLFSPKTCPECFLRTNFRFNGYVWAGSATVSYGQLEEFRCSVSVQSYRAARSCPNTEPNLQTKGEKGISGNRLYYDR